MLSAMFQILIVMVFFALFILVGIPIIILLGALLVGFVVCLHNKMMSKMFPDSADENEE